MDKKYISATDINKFVYCNFSYYYEQVYGMKEIRRLKKIYNEENGYDNKKNINNFERGRSFHNNYYDDKKDIIKIRLLIYIVLIMLLIIYIRSVFFGV
ncbi:MAG: hypothetical protein ACK5LY_09115 [Lachnospirales bacterium]